MNGETLGEISEKISEIDSLIFRADTGQITITWEQYKSLHEDVETLMNMLAQSLAHLNGSSAAAMYEERAKVRGSIRFAATLERYAELHPETNPAVDAIFRAAFNDQSASAQEKLADLFVPMFANKPVPPAPPDTKKRISAANVRAIIRFARRRIVRVNSPVLVKMPRGQPGDRSRYV